MSSGESIALNFVSELLNMEVSKLKEFLLDKKSLRILKRAFKTSISPSSGEMPMSYEECLATYLVVMILKPRYMVETGGIRREVNFIHTLCTGRQRRRIAIFNRSRP